MLCSDGLNSMISDEAIHNVLEESSHKTVCADLIAAANKAGGHDNTTVAVAYLGGKWKSDDSDPDSSTRETLDIKARRPFLKRIWRFISRSK
jgi:serine/threonine protein phosphatase PrpC